MERPAGSDKPLNHAKGSAGSPINHWGGAGFMILVNVNSKNFDEENGLMNASRPSVPGTSVPGTLSGLSGLRHACLTLSSASILQPPRLRRVKHMGQFSYHLRGVCLSYVTLRTAMSTKKTQDIRHVSYGFSNLPICVISDGWVHGVSYMSIAAHLSTWPIL